MKQCLLKACLSGRQAVLSARNLFFACLLLCLGFSQNANAADIVISSEKTWLEAQALDGTPNDGVLNVTGDLVITGTGWINGNVNGANVPAATININVTGNVLIQSGGKITADQIAGSCSGLLGSGGTINIIALGNVTTEINSAITVNAKCSAGTIYIRALGFVDIDGLVESKSTLSGTGSNQRPGGGPITIIAGCYLTINDHGKVSSEGQDPGADLVHLESCIVNIFGLVQSIGAGHVTPNNPATHLVPSNRPEKPDNSTAGVEVWAGTININRTLPHNGEVNADLSAGAAHVSWIDLFASNNINIIGRTSGIFAVHANNGGAGNIGGYISLKSVNQNINASGRVIQANGAFGGSGGSISASAFGDIDFTNAQMNQANGVSNFGGIIDLRSYNASILSNITDTLSVTGKDDTKAGSVHRTACGTIGAAKIIPATALVLDDAGVLCGGHPALFPKDSLPSCSGVGSLTVNKFVLVPSANASPNCFLGLLQDWDFTSDIPGFASFTIHALDPVFIGGTLIGFKGQLIFNNIPPGTYHITGLFVPPVPPSTAFYRPTNDAEATPDDTLLATITLGGCSNAQATFTSTPTNCSPPPPCELSGKTICQGESTELCAPVGTFTYAWSTNETTRCITVDEANTYTVAVTNADGVTSTCSAEVIVNPLPICSVDGNDTICPGSTNHYDAPADMDTYSWTVTGNGTIDGAADGAGIDVIAASSCGTTYTVSVTITLNGCSSTCQMEVAVLDTTKPVITCPDPANLSCGDSSDPSQTGSADATDNCGGKPVITHRDVPVEACIGGGIDRWWKATDACGNADSCKQEIRYVDQGKPVITCPHDTVLQCGQAATPTVTGSATALDNCTNTAITYRDEPVAANCTGRPGINRWWKAVDACGNKDSCLQAITYGDTTKPVITCPAAKTLQCGQAATPTVTGSATALDNCTSTTITYRDESVAANCTGRAGINRWWKAVDACGNRDSCKQEIRYEDATKPVITCPSNKTLQCGQTPTLTLTGTATATDNCSSTTITYRDEPVASNCTGRPGIDRWWKAVDGCGNADSCKQTIRFVDTTPPVITCPADKTVSGETLGENNSCLDLGGGVVSTYDPKIGKVSNSKVGIDFRQPRNQGHPAQPLDWTNGINCLTQSEYFEGQGVPQRLILTGLKGNSHTLRFRHMVVKHQGGDRNAYDFLMSWEQAVLTAAAIGNGSLNELQNLMSQSCGSGISNTALPVCATLSGFSSADSRVRYASPTDSMGNPPNHHGSISVNAAIACFEGIYGNRTIEIRGNSAVTAFTITFDGYTGAVAGDNYAWYTIRWTSQSTNVMIRMAGHASAGSGACGYSKCYGAGAIDGGPYHFKLDLLDGAAMGDRDNQLMVNPPNCSVEIPVTFGSPSYSDNCDASPDLTILVNDSVTYNSHGDKKHCRTWKVTDDCTNASQCSQCITVVCENFHRMGQEEEAEVTGNSIDGINFRAYPNPFNSITTFEFRTDISSHMLVDVYSVTGAKIATIFDADAEPGMTYRAEFNGESLAEGIYVYRIVRGDQVITGKLILMK